MSARNADVQRDLDAAKLLQEENGSAALAQRLFLLQRLPM